MLLRTILLFCLCGLVMSVQAATVDHDMATQKSATSLAASLALSHAWVRAMPPGSQMTAAYFTLTNQSHNTVTLVGASSEIATSAGLHRSTQQQGHASMHAIKQLQVKPGASVTFKPGGLHVMLEGLKLAPRAGDRVPVCLRFVNGHVCEAFLALKRAPN